MKFEDFNATCFEDLEQNLWTNQKIVFEGGRPLVGMTAKYFKTKHKDNCRKVFGIGFCPICATDKELFGDGLFHAFKGSLVSSNRLPCGCSESYRWSTEQREIQIKRLCEKRNYKFMGWVSEHITNKSKVKLYCNMDGCEWTPSISEILTSSKTGCPICGRQGGYKYCYINLISDGEVPIGIKYGVSSTKNRYYYQNKQSVFDITNLFTYKMPDRFACINAERHCSTHLIHGIFTKREIPDGFTETTDLRNIEYIKKVFELFGGELINLETLDDR